MTVLDETTISKSDLLCQINKLNGQVSRLEGEVYGQEGDDMKNFIHLTPIVKRKDRAHNNLMKGDQLTVTIVGTTRQANGSTMIEIEPVKIITLDDRTITL